MNEWTAHLPRRRHPGARRAPRGARPRACDVAVFRNAEDEVFALLDRCPHKGGPLSPGHRLRRPAWPARCTTGRSAWTTAAPTRPTTAARRASRSRSRTARCTLDAVELASHATDLPRPVAGPEAHRRGAEAMPMNETRSTCPYCGVGCGVIIETDGAQITGVRGDPGPSGQLRPPVHQGQRRCTSRPAPRSRMQTRLLQPHAARARAARAPRADRLGRARSTSPPTRFAAGHRASTAPTRSASTSPASC